MEVRRDDDAEPGARVDVDVRKGAALADQPQSGQPFEQVVGDAGAFADQDEDLGVGQAVGEDVAVVGVVAPDRDVVPGEGGEARQRAQRVEVVVEDGDLHGRPPVGAAAPSRRRMTWRAMVSAASSWRSTKLVLAARMSPLSSNVSASGSSSDGSSPRSMAATTSWRTSAGEPALEGGDALLDRPRPGAHLEGGAGEEAPTRERPPQEVVEVGVAQGDELGQPRCCGEGRFDDLGVEDPLGLLHRGQLEVLLGVEVGVDPALAHVEGGGEVADRQALETVDGGQ